MFRTAVSIRRRTEPVRQWLGAHAVDIVLLATGGMFVLVGLLVRAAEQPIAGGVETKGRIVGHADSSEPGSTSRRAVIEFRDGRERLHRFTSGSGGSLVDGEVGDVVTVRYDPDDPSRAQWADEPLQGVWWLALGAGALLLAIEVAIVVRRVTRGRRGGDGRPDEIPASDGEAGPASLPAERDTVPVTITDLFAEPVILVDQTANGLDDSYRVVTEDGREMAVITSADERTHAKVLRTFDMETWSPGAATLVVRNGDGDPLLSIERRFLGTNSSVVRAADGATIVELVQVNHLLQASRFDLHAEGHQVATIVLDGDFVATDRSGRELGRASETGRRWRRVHFPSGVYAISRSPDAPESLARVARAALLSVVATWLDADDDTTM